MQKIQGFLYQQHFYRECGYHCYICDYCRYSIQTDFFQRELQDQGFATACELLWIRRGDWKPDDSTFVGLVIYVLCKSECFLRMSSGQLLLWRYRKWPHSSVDVWPNNYFPEDFVVLIVSFKSCIFVLFCYVCLFLRKVLKIRYALGRPIPYGVQCSSVRYICNSSCPVSKCQNGNDKNINLEALKLFFLYPCPLCPSLSVTHYFH